MPCPYAFALGIPGKGVHAARVLGLALNDILMTLGVAVITAYLFQISFLSSFAGWFVLGEVLHYVFGSQTAFLTAIGVQTGCPLHPL